MYYVWKFSIVILLLNTNLCFSFENRFSFLNSLPGSGDKDIRSRIVYGDLASPYQFPYFGHYVIQRSSGWIFCGSTLIHPKWVLGSAHCVRGMITGNVGFGTNDKQRMAVYRVVTRVISHPGYQNPHAVANDISLSELIAEVPLSFAINIAQLPTRSDSMRSYAGQHLTISGFGWNLFEYPRFLHYASLIGISDQTCAHHHWVFLNTMVCAVGARYGSSMCGGDSGGPLILSNNGVDTVIGVSTFVQSASCINDVQGFMRVDKYLDWISFYTGISIRN